MANKPLGWYEVEKQLQASLDVLDEGLSLDDIAKNIDDGAAQFHYHNKCAMVTHVSERSHGDICGIWLSAGKIDAIRELEKHVAKWAKGIGCVEMRYYGRKGWTKINPEYETMGVIARRKI